MNTSLAADRPTPRWAAPAAILALGVLAYCDALDGPMVFDDVSQLQANPLIRNLSELMSAAGYRATPNRYVAYLTFALNYRLGGLEVLGYHLVNVAIHLAAALLVYALVLTTFRTPRLGASAVARHAREIGFLAAALFVTHPIQTQAVTYIVQRITSLTALLYLLAVLLYARWRLSAERAPLLRVGLYLAAVAAALLAARTKEIAFTLPVALALYELSFLEPGPPLRRWAPFVPFLAAAALIPVSWLGSAGGPAGGMIGSLAEGPRVQTALPRIDYLLTEAPVILRYLGLLLLPVGQNLDPDVPVRRSLLDPGAALGGAAILGLLALAVYLYRRTAGAQRTPVAADPALRLVAFGICWFFVTLSVESSVIPIVDVMNEHRVYLPSVGAFMAFAAAGLLLLRRRLGDDRAPRAAAAAGLALGLVLAAATLVRNTVWSNPITLWADAASKSPGKARPVLNLGTALAEAGRYREAVPALRRAASLDPAFASAHAQLAAALLATDQPGEAEPELREALRLAPEDPEASFNLGMLLFHSGRREEAAGWFRRYLSNSPATEGQVRRFAEAHAGP